MEEPHGVMDIVAGMDMVTKVQILDKTVCISHSANTLEKGMNPTIPPLTGNRHSDVSSNPGQGCLQFP